MAHFKRPKTKLESQVKKIRPTIIKWSAVNSRIQEEEKKTNTSLCDWKDHQGKQWSYEFC